jgi:hypothetical protein
VKKRERARARWDSHHEGVQHRETRKIEREREREREKRGKREL